jgi:hypothetical protein
MVYFCDMVDSDDAIALTLYKELRNFKFIYYLYFFIDILNNFFLLNIIFQQKFVDVFNIGFVIKAQVVE